MQNQGLFQAVLFSVGRISQRIKVSAAGPMGDWIISEELNHCIDYQWALITPFHVWSPQALCKWIFIKAAERFLLPENYKI